MTEKTYTEGDWIYRASDRLVDTIERLRAVNAELVDALERIAQLHDGNPSDAMADMPQLDYARHMLGVARYEARAALAKAEGGE